MNWHKDWKHCRHCGRTDRKYHAKGWCKHCYQYWRDHEAALRKHKAQRLKLTPEQIQAKYQQQEEWRKRNLLRDRRNKVEWNHRNGKAPKYVEGATVWYLFCHVWCEGTITKVYPSKARRLLITLKGGTQRITIARYCKLERPELTF
jgi:hypothetical protein